MKSSWAQPPLLLLPMVALFLAFRIAYRTFLARSPGLIRLIWPNDTSREFAAGRGREGGVYSRLGVPFFTALVPLILMAHNSFSLLLLRQELHS